MKQKFDDDLFLDTAVLKFLKKYAPFSPSKKKLTPTGKILAASAEKLMTELLSQPGMKRKLDEVRNGEKLECEYKPPVGINARKNNVKARRY